MKFYYIILILGTLFLTSCSTYFSGEISYNHTFIVKNDEVDIESLIKSNSGSTSKYVIKDGKYKMTTYKNGYVCLIRTYLDSSNHIYKDFASMPIITYIGADKTYKKFSIPILIEDSLDMVMNYKVKYIKYETNDEKYKEYFSEKIKVDPKFYSKHHSDNLNNRMLVSNGGIPLKVIKDHQDYTHIMEAVKITKRRLKDKDFELSAKEAMSTHGDLDTPVQSLDRNGVFINCVLEVAQNLSESEMYEIGGQKTHIGIIVRKDGSVEYLINYATKGSTLYKFVEDVNANCERKFAPGIINGKKVTSFLTVPYKF